MRAIFGLVLAGLVAWSQPALAACYGKGATRTCVDESGNVTITTDTGNGMIRMDQNGNVTVRSQSNNGSITTSGDQTTVQTYTKNGTITTDQDGNVVSETKFDKGSITVGSNPNSGDAWSKTTIESGATVVTQTEHNGKVATQLEQGVGGGYVLRSVTDSDGKTTNTTCDPYIGCQ